MLIGSGLQALATSDKFEPLVLGQIRAAGDIQVRYEMLRRVSVEKTSVTDASDQYGVSRPTYYQARADFEEAGIAGLVPKKRGPRGPHKIQAEVLEFLRTQLVPGEPIRARELARLIQQEFGLDVHPRTIERVVSGKKTLR
jgi:transposase